MKEKVLKENILLKNPKELKKKVKMNLITITELKIIEKNLEEVDIKIIV